MIGRLTINVKKNGTPTIVMSESSLLWMGKGILQRALSSALSRPDHFTVRMSKQVSNA